MADTKSNADDASERRTSIGSNGEAAGEDSSEGDEDFLREYDGENEEDLQRAMAEQAKEEVRRQLRELKAIYRSIKQRNNEIPEKFRLRESEIKLPPEIFADEYARIQEKCEEVYRIHEYESAETIIQLEKIQKFYFDPIETMHVVVKDITHELQAHSLRNRKICKEFKDLNERNQNLIEEEAGILRQQAVATESEIHQTTPEIPRIYAKDILGEYESKLETYDIDTVHNIRHLEKRLEQRYNREVAWQKLMSEKIEPDYIPPEDEEALEKAKSETGAFQLQISESYLGENITIPERRQRIVDMKFFIREKTSEFNEMLLAARDEKPKIIQECRRLEKEIRKVHVLLPEEYRRKIPPIYEIEPEEIPESIMDIRQEDVDFEENVLLTNAGLEKVRDDINEDYFGISKPDKVFLDEGEEQPSIPPPAATRTARQAKVVDLEFESVGSHRGRRCKFTGQSEIDKKTFEVQFYPILFRQEMLFKDLLRVIDYFHQRVKFLYDLRLRLDLDFKVKAVSLLTMIGELDIAKEFYAQEKAILERLRAQQAECKDAKKQMEKIKKRLIKVNADMKKCEMDILGIAKEVEVVIGSKSRFSEYLWRVFKKKIKIEHEGDNEGEEDDAAELQHRNTKSSESSDSSASTSQNSGSNLYKLPKQKMDINICPDHLDRSIYNKIIELRQKKTNIEQEMDANKRLGERVSAEYIEIEKVYQKYEGRLTDISEEIRVLQRRRQKKFNDLQLMVIMRADQIQCLDNMDELASLEGNILEKLARGFPGTGNVIIFPKGGTGGLESRSTELTTKAKEEKERYKKGRRMLIRLRQELKKAEKEVERLKKEVKDEMILKFGQEVDLDKITAVIINLELLDQEIILDKMKKAQYRERERVAEEVENVKYELTKKIEDHSKYNMMKAMMLERRRDLEYYIWKNDPKSNKRQPDLESEPEAEKKAARAATDGDGDGDCGCGGGDAPAKSKSAVENVEKPLDNCLTHSEVSVREFDQLEKEIEDARRILRIQQQRIQELKSVISKCRTKSGLPPLIPLTQTQSVESVSTLANQQQQKPLKKFTKTATELEALNRFCEKHDIKVCTIFKAGTPETKRSASLQSPEEDLVTLHPSIFDHEEISDMNFDYSSGEDDDDVNGGEAAMRGLHETIAELLPDDEQEFMKYLEEKATQDVDHEAAASAAAAAADEESEEDANDGQGPSDSDNDETQQNPKKKKKASRKSILEISENSKGVTEAEVLGNVRRISKGTAKEKEEKDQMKGLEFVGAEIEKAMLERKASSSSKPNLQETTKKN